MKPHDLTREAEPDTGSLLIGRKERYKNFLLAFWSVREPLLVTFMMMCFEGVEGADYLIYFRKPILEDLLLFKSRSVTVIMVISFDCCFIRILAF